MFDLCEEKGDDEHGRQDDRESDDSSLSSPASQGNEEFGGTKDDPSALVKDTAKEISDHLTQGIGINNGIAIALERGTGDKKVIVDLASQDACGYLIPEKSEHAETSTHSNLVNKKSDEKKEYPSPGKDNGKVATLPGSAAGESTRNSEAPVSSEEEKVASLFFFLHHVFYI